MNWTKSTLGAITEWLKTGKTPPTKEEKYFNGSVKWYTPGDLDNGKYLGQSKRTISVTAFKDKKAVNILPNCLLVTCIGDIAKLGITTDECSSNQQITAFKPKEFVDVEFLYYWFSKNKGFLQNCANNAVVPIINNGTLTKLPFSYPPLETQKKIAEILDTADTLRQKDKALIEKYNQLTQSLFLEMFGDPRINSQNFPIKKMDSIASKVTDGEHATPKRSEKGFKLLSARNIQFGYIDLNKGVDYVDEDEFNRIYKRCNPEKGDILISCSGSIGRVTVNNLSEPFVLVRSVALIKPKYEFINSFYLEHYLRTSHMQTVMINRSKSSSQANLFTGPIKNLDVLLPPLDLQNKFASLVEEIEKQKQLAQGNLVKSEALFNSLLQRAFKGELV